MKIVRKCNDCDFKYWVDGKYVVLKICEPCELMLVKEAATNKTMEMCFKCAKKYLTKEVA